MRPASTYRSFFSTVVILLIMASWGYAEVMIQWFETEWNEIYRRMPEVAEIGYDYIWIPPPTKGPTGLGTKWGNVGYSLYDRFDIGDVPQRGSWATRYGTRGDLRNMVNVAHYSDVKIIPDIIMNHNGNGPDFRSYPGMVPEDFHVQWEANHCNSLNYKRGPKMWEWYHSEGYGGTMWQELVNLIDVRTEPDDRFTGGNNTPDWNLVGGTSYLRHVGQYDRYPYYSVNQATYSNENASAMLGRWITWLGNAMDYDGMRLDAGKHVPREFFGTRGSGFLHEAQYNFNQRRGYSDSSSDEADQLFQNYIRRDDLLIFAEILSYQSELAYWFGGEVSSVANNTQNPMRFIDYPLKQKLYDAFSNGNLANLQAGGGGIAPELGIMYAWGHDEAGPGKVNLAYAYILTHIGFPMVYFTGNNITWDDNGSKTWMRPGYDSQALGDSGNDIRNLIWIHQQFARGREYDRKTDDNDLFIYERYSDDGDSTPESGEGLLLVGLNDSGWDKSATVTCTFPDGTALHDYTGHYTGSDPVVSGGQVTITVPGNYGQGWSCYAPRNADGVSDSVQVKQDGVAAPTMTWVVPGGIHSGAKTQQITRITSTNISIDAFFNPVGGSVNSVMLKWGQGNSRFTATNDYDTSNDIVSGHYEKCMQRNSTNWYMDIQITATNIPEGLQTVRARVFNARSGLPPLFNTFTKNIYVDRRGPELVIAYPNEGQTVYGDCVALISNIDFTAYGMGVSLDNGPTNTAHEIMKGLWKYNLAGLTNGTHTMKVITTEADWADSRSIINTSIYTRTFTVQTNAQPITLNFADGAEQQTPFFSTAVNAPGSPSLVRLYWDGYELPFNGGNYTNVFNGEVVFRDPSNVVTERLWGAFVNGQHFFEAIRVDGTVTSRISSRVCFNLYGINAIDSDGDSIPDNVEMPGIDTEGAPGADAAWPGDSNKDFVPNYGETWTKLNPYNHSTYYSGQWDDQNDFDGDGYSNGREVLAGYNEGNIYKYDIYSSSSKPSSLSSNKDATASWTPNPAQQSTDLQITYSPNDGPLKDFNPVYLHIGHSKKTQGEWQNVTSLVMTAVSTNWVANYSVPADASSVDFCFRSADSNTWDNNNGADWQANVLGASAGSNFVMDGYADSDNYAVWEHDMYIWAAIRGTKLYVATWATTNAGSDHFVYVTDELGDAHTAPWGKTNGNVFVDLSSKPYITSEGDNGFHCWNNISGLLSNNHSMGNAALEGQIDLVTAFGKVPEVLYVAAVAYNTDNATVNSSGPYQWDMDMNVTVTEFLRVPTASIVDNDEDLYFDVGKPQMWTVVGTDTNDANYGLRRFFLNELAGDSSSITVLLKPNVGGTNVVSDVELFSNLNRRDFAVLPGEEDPDTVSVDSKTTYYRAYTMTSNAPGTWSVTIPVNKCGAYRINARYKVNDDPFIYYTDQGLRHDCAVVVSPKKALDVTMYEMNPLYAEATNDNFYGRSTFEDMYIANTDRYDVVNSNHFPAIGVNMIWLQPIHPIGTDGRETDPATGSPYDPGSPYAVRNYWQVNPVLGDPYVSDGSQAMTEFTNFVNAMDGIGVGVMLDGTFNHSAWDCEIGEGAVELGLATNASDLIRHVRPQWYSKQGKYGEQASYYETAGNTDIATAPDRIDFGKWSDAADFFFGKYDALVQEAPANTNWAWSSQWYSRYQMEEDRFEGFPTNNAYTKQLWQYFAYYPIYWLEKTGHPQGTPKVDSNKGIDGLRCDFAQGLPSLFWEYVINHTRSVKWDFLFMAESLDGYTEIGGSKRHGIGYRSARHFDILNENMVFYWRNDFFAYPYQGNLPDHPNYGKTPAPYTDPIRLAFDNRRQAFDTIPILLDLSCHDEVYPSHDPYRILYAHSTLAAMDGIPMLLCGQEAGAQNDANTYDFSFDDATPSSSRNAQQYEVNFGKSIPNFKRYNSLKDLWANRDWALQEIYGRINRARQNSRALKSQGVYFLNKQTGGGVDSNICAIAKFETAGVSAASQDVVFAFINNNFNPILSGSTNRWQTYALNATTGGNNWFGIESGHSYNIVDLMSSSPTSYIWGSAISGDDLIANGITVGLTGNPYLGEQAQYIKLVDMAVGLTNYPGYNNPDYRSWDVDNDNLPDAWEVQMGMSTTNGTGVNGPDGDRDGDGVSNYDEFIAGTDADNSNDLLTVEIDLVGNNPEISWPGKTNINYVVERANSLVPASWQSMYFGTALSENESVADSSAGGTSNRFYRVKVQP